MFIQVHFPRGSGINHTVSRGRDQACLVTGLCPRPSCRAPTICDKRYRLSWTIVPCPSTCSRWPAHKCRVCAWMTHGADTLSRGANTLPRGADTLSRGAGINHTVSRGRDCPCCVAGLCPRPYCKATVCDKREGIDNLPQAPIHFPVGPESTIPCHGTGSTMPHCRFVSTAVL